MTDLSLSSREDVLRILTDARALIAKPWAWFKGDFHYIRSVKTKYEGTKQVDCYCALGALRRAAGVPVTGRLHSGTGDLPGYLAAVNVLGAVVNTDVATWNDRKRTNKKDVLAAFDEAIDTVNKENSNG